MLWNEHDSQAIPSVLHPDLSFRGSLGDEKRGHDGFAEYVDEVHRSLAGYRCTIEELVADGDRVFARMRFAGTHRGELMGFPATGARVAWQGAALFTFDGGLIRDVWVLGDLRSLEEQLRSASCSADRGGELARLFTEHGEQAGIEIRPFDEADLAGALALWAGTEGLGLNESDSDEALRRFLVRNPGCSAVALDPAGVLVGAVLCGHDGRRGTIHHLAVHAAHRGQGIAQALLAHCCRALEQSGVPRCNVFLYDDNVAGTRFWERHGFAAAQGWRTLQRRIVEGGG